MAPHKLHSKTAMVNFGLTVEIRINIPFNHTSLSICFDLNPLIGIPNELLSSLVTILTKYFD